MDLVIEHFDLDERPPEPNVRREQSGRRWILPQGFPFLMDVDTGEVVTPVLSYCAHRFHGPGSFSEGEWKLGNSAEAAVSDLKDWWWKLQVTGVPWDVADDDLVAEWLIDLRTTVSGRTKDFLSDATVSRRAATISEFYRWAFEEGQVERAPTVRASKRLVRIKTSGKAVTPGTWGRSNADPHPLDAKLIPDFEVGMGKLPSELAEVWTPDPTKEGSLWRQRPDRTVSTSRDRIAFELGLCCGMRIDEILNLDIVAFEDFECADSEVFKLFELTITHTKGLVPREVFIPFWLMAEIATYIRTERRIAGLEAERVWKGSLPRRLLVNPPGSGRHVGKAARAETVEQRFRETCIDLGLVKRTAIAKGTKQAAVAIEPRYVFHDLRHTFAVWMYHALEDIGIARPWIRIQKLLGHASVSTTVGTYLKVLDSFGPETLERVARTFQAMRDRWRGDDQQPAGGGLKGTGNG